MLPFDAQQPCRQTSSLPFSFFYEKLVQNGKGARAVTHIIPELLSYADSALILPLSASAIRFLRHPAVCLVLLAREGSKTVRFNDSLRTDCKNS